MVTRLYLRSDKPQGEAPTTNWADSSALQAGVAMGLSTTKQSTPQPSPRGGTGLTGTSLEYLQYVFISDPLSGSGTISGTLKGQMLASEASTSSNLMAQVKAYIVDGITGDIKSTLFAGTAGALASEFVNSVTTNRRFPNGGPLAITSQSFVAGDRIMLQVGARGVSTSITATFPGARMDGTGTDLPEDESTTTAGMAPWFEFSQTLSFSTAVSMLNAHDDLIVEAFERDFIPYTEMETGGGGAPIPTTGQIWPRGSGLQ